ncbi:MAG: glycosyltransferase family 39 protein, partial [Candidatus Chisholmbacteria bacterium]|nr:glycosyltransferase family 39 protein [Candidatus Chisholmbacteria bacterium]
MSFLTQNYLTRGFWGDEAWTALISQFSLPDILRITGEDFHPPLYYFLVHFFIVVFGASEWIRAVSTLFFLLTVVAVYFLAREFVGRGEATLLAILTLTSPILVTYAFEARAYALVALISTASTLLFWLALKTRRWRWWGLYILLGMAGMYTHYYLWFIFAAHGVYWLAFSRQQFKRVVVTYLLMLAGQVPWIPTLLSQVGSVAGNYWIAPITSQTHWEFFIRVTAGDDGVPQQKFVAVVVAVLLGISLLTMVIDVLPGRGRPGIPSSGAALLPPSRRERRLIPVHGWT